MAAAVASATFYSEDAASPQTASKPASTASGDLLVYAIAQGDSVIANLTAPAGWTATSSANGGSVTGKLWTKVAGGSEPATYDFPYSSGADVAAVMIRVTGADTTPTLVQAVGTAGPNAGSVDSPTVTPTGADDALIVVMSAACGGTTLVETDPSGTTDLGQGQVAGGFQAMAAAWQALASGSATGAKTWTSITPATKPGVTFSLAIKSAAGGGGSTSANAEATSGTGAASNATTAVAPTAEATTGTGTASDAAASAGVSAEATAATGTASSATIDVQAAAGQAAATGTASDATIAITANAEATSATGSAFDATVSTAANTSANAEAATATGTAYDASASIAVPAALATASGIAYDAVAGLSPAAAVATALGAAYDASISISAPAEAAAAVGAAYDATVPMPSTGLTGNAHGPTALAAGAVTVHTVNITGAVT